MIPVAGTTAGRLAPVSLETLPPYAFTTYVDFSQPEHRAAFEAALASVRSELGRSYPLVIAGHRVEEETRRRHVRQRDDAEADEPEKPHRHDIRPLRRFINPPDGRPFKHSLLDDPLRSDTPPLKPDPTECYSPRRAA